ncbi:Golgi-associated plant pathogenesis-related protein 1-like [Dermatophagoides pteronyssinus]|uniref:Golgi-associated plant pathogenesis-related protein 1-like n=1 Tax=Dermatophagoides pteronyssinus TaxID=6956 RepID=UPI003F67160E
MESTETKTRKWRESDGTEVIETTTIRRIRTSSGKMSTVSSANNASTVNYTSNQFEKDALNRHNYYRARHGVPNLELSNQLCQHAQEWANKLAESSSMKHRSENKYGENIFMKSGTNISIHGNDAVDAWYDEIHKFNFHSPSFQPGTGHFTQVVWRESKYLGIAYAKRGSSIFVVANYDPAGNYQGHFKENVPRPK